MSKRSQQKLGFYRQKPAKIFDKILSLQYGRIIFKIFQKQKNWSLRANNFSLKARVLLEFQNEKCFDKSNQTFLSKNLTLMSNIIVSKFLISVRNISTKCRVPEAKIFRRKLELQIHNIFDRSLYFCSCFKANIFG